MTPDMHHMRPLPPPELLMPQQHITLRLLVRVYKMQEYIKKCTWGSLDVIWACCWWWQGKHCWCLHVSFCAGDFWSHENVNWLTFSCDFCAMAHSWLEMGGAEWLDVRRNVKLFLVALVLSIQHELRKAYVPEGEYTYLWAFRPAIALVTLYSSSPYAYEHSHVLKMTVVSSEQMYFTWNISYWLYCPKSELHTHITQFKYNITNLHIYICLVYHIFGEHIWENIALHMYEIEVSN